MAISACSSLVSGWFKSGVGSAELDTVGLIAGADRLEGSKTPERILWPGLGPSAMLSFRAD